MSVSACFCSHVPFCLFATQGQRRHAQLHGARAAAARQALQRQGGHFLFDMVLCHPYPTPCAGQRRHAWPSYMAIVSCCSQANTIAPRWTIFCLTWCCPALFNTLQANTGTPSYMAPELLQPGKPYSAKVDVCS